MKIIGDYPLNSSNVEIPSSTDINADIAEIKEKVNEIHAFLMEFAAQMEAMGNNPMVKALVGGMLPKIGKRNGNSRG